LQRYESREYSYITSLAADPIAGVWFAVDNGSAIGHVLPNGRVHTYRPLLGSPVDRIATAADGSIWVTAIDEQSVGLVAEDGTVTKYALPNVPPCGASCDSAFFRGSFQHKFAAHAVPDTLWYLTAQRLVTISPSPLPPAPSG